jgi:hypothetical protein
MTSDNEQWDAVEPFEDSEPQLELDEEAGGQDLKNGLDDNESGVEERAEKIRRLVY